MALIATAYICYNLILIKELMMRVFNQNKTVELTEYDLTKGYLIDDEIVTEHEAEIVHHPAVEAVDEQSHYEVIAEYPNGGKDVQKVIDVEAVEAKEAYDEVVKEAYTEHEPIQIYIQYTESELKRNALSEELASLKDWLSSHDYVGVKIATGRATVDEYKDIIAEMTEKADRINEIEAELASL